MRLTRLDIQSWRNFPSASLKIGPRLFLVGPNASGKSNLLDALRFLRDLASDGGGLQEAIRSRGGITKLRCLSARRKSDVIVSVELREDTTSENIPTEVIWTYSISFNQTGRQKPHIQHEKVTRNGELLVQRPEESDKDDRARLEQTHLEQVSANHPFRSIAEFFSSIEYHHIVPQLVRAPDGTILKDSAAFGSDLLHRIAETQIKRRQSILRRIERSLNRAVPQLSELELTKDEVGKPHLEARYEHWRPQKARQNEHQFSDGTLRLIGLLWSLLDGEGPLLLEEPELSLHPGIVKKIPALMHHAQKGKNAARQVIASTHSADLLSDPSIGLDEIAILYPKKEGTSVEVAISDSEIRELLDSGIPLPEIILPRTAPKLGAQGLLFN